MLLGNRKILEAMDAGDLAVDQFSEDMLQPASIDLTLSRYFALQAAGTRAAGSPEHSLDQPLSESSFIQVDAHEGILRLYPGEFALAACGEKIALSENLAGRLEGKSSLGRLGLAIHVTAGFIDPGFVGWPTLELVNHSRRTLVLQVGMPVAQLSLFRVEGCDMPYGSSSTGSKYQHQGRRPAISQFHRNFNKEA